MKVTCDKCQTSFNVVLKEENKMVGKQNITRTYIECPACKKQYDTYYDNQATLVLKKQIRKAMAEAETIVDETKKTKHLKGIEKKKRRLEKEERILQTKFLKGE